MFTGHHMTWRFSSQLTVINLYTGSLGDIELDQSKPFGAIYFTRTSGRHASIFLVSPFTRVSDCVLLSVSIKVSHTFQSRLLICLSGSSDSVNMHTEWHIHKKYFINRLLEKTDCWRLTATQTNCMNQYFLPLYFLDWLKIYWGLFYCDPWK